MLLYLNDPEESDLVGGEMYLVDRRDLVNETEPSYSGVGLAYQLQHTLKVKPHCGNLAIFTSDARNLHGTMPIWKGTRYAMPLWYTDISQMHKLPEADVPVNDIWDH